MTRTHRPVTGGRLSRRQLKREAIRLARVELEAAEANCDTAATMGDGTVLQRQLDDEADRRVELALRALSATVTR